MNEYAQIGHPLKIILWEFVTGFMYASKQLWIYVIYDRCYLIETVKKIFSCLCPISIFTIIITCEK